ncbi:alpha/beta fold hydrolase [Streptomyces sp. NPDC005963]|uniref:esterase/lipase family protein n=1 Tax=Streptomyces sp. NPDC005963 TaxID=3156721 RepID=UPI0033E9B19A
MRLVRLLIRSGAALAVAVALMIPTAPTARADTRDPVLFVHGLGGAGHNWNTMIAEFVEAGWSRDRLHAMSYDSARSSESIAVEIRDEVNALKARTGATKVDVVGHSLGALNSRWYIKFLGGTAQVDDWVSIGGVNRGTYGALTCLLDSCREAWPGSDFLDALNGGDPTPGAVDYTTVWSSCDEAVNPDYYATLEGATNWYAGCVGHITLIFAPHVIDRTMSAVA